MRHLTSKCVVIASLLLMSGCDWRDQYRDRFPLVKTGDARTKVVAIMGQNPDTAAYVEVAGVRAERLTWHVRPLGRTYSVDCVAEHVLVKSMSE